MAFLRETFNIKRGIK